MNQRGRKRRKRYTLQILWIVAALIASTSLLLGYKLGISDQKEKESSIVNAAEQPKDLLADTLLTLTPTLQPILTSAPTIAPTIITPTVTPSPEPEPTPQGPYQVYDPGTQEQEVTPTPVVDENEKPVEETEKMIALTFDDGPYPPVTDRILKILREYNSHATFFVMGSRVETYQDTLVQAHEDGNQIGNHTFNHKDLTKLSVEDIKYEIQYANKKINQSAKVGEAYLRPPYGAKNDIVKETVGVPMIAWSVDTLDWKTKNADSIYKEIMSTVKDGDILLMHDLYPSTADAMEKVIPELIRQGYKLVTVQELLEARGITPEAGVVYYNARP